MDSFINKETHRLFEQLIKEVQNHEVLWDSKVANYRRKNESAIAWSEISRKLNISEFAAKSKWKMLRTIFQRHYKLYKPNTLKEYKGKWRYFEFLWFLSDANPVINGTKKNLGLFKQHFGDKDKPPKKIPIVVLDDNTMDNTSEPIEICDDSHNSLNSNNSVNIDELIRRAEDVDSDENFLRSLTPFFRKLNPVRNLIVRKKIENILMEELSCT